MRKAVRVPIIATISASRSGSWRVRRRAEAEAQFTGLARASRKTDSAVALELDGTSFIVTGRMACPMRNRPSSIAPPACHFSG
jgi:hypothetical protein